MTPNTPTDDHTKQTKFAGWRMTAIAFFLDFIQVGFFFYSFGIFFMALTEEFGATRLGVSLAFMISGVVGAIFGPFIGQLLDKQSSIKPIMIVGALMLATGYGLLSQITAMWQFYFIAGTLLAIGGSTMGGQSSSKLVANWFVKKRGVALGVATMGISGSGVLMPALASFLIDEFGWRHSYMIFAVSILILAIPVILIWVVTKPEDIGQLPDGEIIEKDKPTVVVEPQTEWTSSAILKSSNFWLIALTFAILVGVFQAILIHLVPQLMDMGFQIEQAAFALSIAAILGVLGKLVFGWLIDNFHPSYAVWVCIASQALGALGIIVFSDYSLLLVAAAVYGFGMGGVVPLNGAICGVAFGRLSFGRVMGLMRPATLPIQGAMTPLSGWIYDQTGSYLYAFEIFFGAWLVAAIAIALVKLPGMAAKTKN